ncbi:MAG: glucose 1-dehydrogenase [Candidatus Sericytochromatia bacterium]|nr:glucose 1-dehydrogenase [Candidatus Sericytochromatia bacterium]
MLEGKVAYITGATRGIGWETAQLFARHGATVLINGHRDADALAARVDALKQLGSRESLGFLGDVADPAEVGRIYQAIFKAFKRLDVLVNNAGVLEDGLVGMVPRETVERVMAVNALGPIYNLHAAARLMSRARRGSIINISSIIGTHGNAGQTVYGASKAAVIGLTYSAAKELAPQNIRVNAVAPGYIATDMIRNLPPEKHQERVDSIKLGRVGTPTDVAQANLFLASELSSYITGQVIGVDGGMLI